MSGFSEGILKGSQAGAQLIQNMQAPERMRMEQRRLALEEEASKRADRTVSVQEGQLGLAERRMQMEEQTPENQWNRSLAMKLSRAAVTITKVISDIPPTASFLKPILEDIDSEKINTRADLRNALLNAKISGALSETRISLREQAAKLIEKGDKKGAEKLMQLWDITSDDKYEDFVDDLMQKPYALRRSASERPQQARQPDVGVQKAYYAPDGSIQYLGTKETPPAGYVPFSPEYTIKAGDTTITQGGNPYLQKRLPAGEVQKIGELQTYTKTIDQINDILKGEKITGKKLTGPFEFIQKYVDKYDIANLGDKDRINLRTLVARLPGVMYAMRGKQLSDKELEIALQMMPSMDMDDKSFSISLKNFSGYMNDIIKSKREAFESSGYKAPNIKRKLSDISDNELQNMSDEEIMSIYNNELNKR